MAGVAKKFDVESLGELISEPWTSDKVSLSPQFCVMLL